MTLREAIARLETFAAKHGDDVKLYFDCPDCKQAFAPDLVEAEYERRLVVSSAATKEPDHG